MIQTLMLCLRSGNKTVISLGLGFALMGCSDYEVKFNDRAIYTPEPLFSDYRLADSALKDCVQQTIKDKRITAVKDLTVLVCTNAGITSLDGLATFDHLEQLNLAHNSITDVGELTQLPQLKRLDISGNGLKDVAPLATLAHLKQLDLSGNPALDCGQAAKLVANTDAQVTVPDHCD